MSKLIQVRSTTEATSVVDTLKLALEALERCVEKFYVMRTQKLLGCIPNDAVFASGAILAIREALAEQPAQQEPVAWRTKNASPPGGYVVFQQYPQAVADLGGAIEPLYTSPQPSKPWLGLTDEERGQVYSDWRWNGSNSSNLELCQAIEAKLREKNHG